MRWGCENAREPPLIMRIRSPVRDVGEAVEVWRPPRESGPGIRDSVPATRSIAPAKIFIAHPWINRRTFGQGKTWLSDQSAAMPIVNLHPQFPAALHCSDDEPHCRQYTEQSCPPASEPRTL